MKYFFNSLIVLMALVTIVSGCKPDCEDPRNPECPNFDPCIDSPGEVKADFYIYESGGLAEKQAIDRNRFEPYDTDTIAVADAVFVAIEDDEDADYTWYIGSQVLKGRSVSRRQFPEGKNIPITLVVKRSPDLDCFPNDDGYDSLTRTMYRIPPRTKHAYDGTYIGEIKGNQGPVTVTIKTDSFFLRPSNRTSGPFSITSLYPYEGCTIGGLSRPSAWYLSGGFVGYRQLSNAFVGYYVPVTDSLCGGVYDIWIKRDTYSDSIEIDYHIYPWIPGTRTHETTPEKYLFKGVLKIN
ncbi:MAG: hypothetical protein AB8F95_04720 [Bacteroidia bacterium]